MEPEYCRLDSDCHLSRQSLDMAHLDASDYTLIKECGHMLPGPLLRVV